MLCYECKLNGFRREAVGLCRQCGVALCEEHAHVDPAPVVATYANRTFPSITGTVELPRPTRVVLCGVCHAALSQQKGSAKAATANAVHAESNVNRAA